MSTTNITFKAQHVEELKAEGHLFAAGALARSLGLGPSYGCHYGLRSTLEHDRAAYDAGWHAADHDRASR